MTRAYHRVAPLAPVPTGKTFGRWTVTEEGGRTGASQRMWRCRCECGNVVDVRPGNLTSGRSTQCRPCGDGERDGAWTADEEFIVMTRDATEAAALTGRGASAIRMRLAVLNGKQYIRARIRTEQQ